MDSNVIAAASEVYKVSDQVAIAHNGGLLGWRAGLPTLLFSVVQAPGDAMTVRHPVSWHYLHFPVNIENRPLSNVTWGLSPR